MVTEEGFWTAATAGDRDAVQALVSHDADRSLRDRDGSTAGSHARAQGHVILAARLEAPAWS